MDFHLDRNLRLKSGDEIEHQGLYKRAIIELDDAGRQVGGDMIPWVWTVGFVATEFVVSDIISLETIGLAGRERSELQRSRRTTIQAKLRPGRLREEQDSLDREPAYRFFGTDREITDFHLHILPAEEGETEECSAWGSVSYDAEVDFRTAATADTIMFYLMVSQSLYDRYLWNIGQGLANRLALSVGRVNGFYAEWSPGITTRDIKVLAGSEHVVEGSDEHEWPRLGKVGQAEFHMNGHYVLSMDPTSGVGDAREAAAEGRRGFHWPGRR